MEEAGGEELKSKVVLLRIEVKGLLMMMMVQWLLEMSGLQEFLQSH